MSGPAARTLVLRPDTYRVPVDDGVYFFGNHGPVRLTGASIAQWVERLAPYLDGRYTLDDLVQGLAPQRRELLEQVVAALRSRDVVRERGEGPPGTPVDGPAAPRHPHEIAFLDYFQDAAVAAFARYRSATAVVVGSGPLLPAVVRAARRSGLATVRVAEGPGPEDPADLVAGADLVLQVDAGGSAASVEPVERACARAGVPLAQAMLSGRGQAWLVPAGPATAPRWSAAQPRLHDGDATPDPADASPDPADAGPAAYVAVAGRLVHGAFRLLTGAGPPADPDRVVRVDLDTLESQQHRFLPYPLGAGAAPAPDRSEAGFRARVAALAAGGRLTDDELSRQAAPCIDDRFGIVALREHDWVQSPLHVTEGTAHPARPDGAGRTQARTIRVGFTYQAARVGATMRALAHYGELTVDPRRLADDTVWGYEVSDPDRVRRVPAAVAFPRLRAAAPAAGALAGLSAGFDWEDAVRGGLLGCCRWLTLAALPDGSGRYPAVDLAAAELDPDGTRCRDVLTAIGERPEVYDVTGALGVPTYACCLGPDPVAVTTGPTRAAALSAGLLQVLRAVQARVHDQPAVAPPAGPPLPPPRRGGPAEPGGPGGPGGPGPAADWDVAALAGRLREAGRVAVAVPLDHDPRLAELMPYLVHVVLLP